MTSPDREPPLSRILANCQSSKERLDLEHKILKAAFKHSYESGDKDGAAVAHKGLMAVISQQLFSGDGSSTGSVIPKSFWDRANAEPQQEETVAHNGSGHDENLTAELEPFDEAAVTQLSAEPSEAQQAAQALADISAAAAKDLIHDVAVAAEELGLSPDSTLPEGGPTSYLDFDAEDEPPANPNFQTAEPISNIRTTEELPRVPGPPAPPPPPHGMQAPPSAVPVPESEPPPRTPSQMIRTQSFYQIIGVNNLSSFEEIHLKFLRIMRRLLQSRYSTESPIGDMREFREVLRAICVAHDVLKDPVTRTDYDLRQMGMRTTEAQTAQAQKEQKASGSQTKIRLMLGELLECAKILDPTELEIALDMHKAEPGLQFGEFLVRAHFLNRDELDAAILAQRLISSGKITIAQFKTAMTNMRDAGTAFLDIIVTEGWVTSADILDENSEFWGGSGQAPASAPVSNVVKAEPPPWITGDMEEIEDEESEVSPPTKLSGENAVPQWADNLDWNESDATGDTTRGASSTQQSGMPNSEDQEQNTTNGRAALKNDDATAADKQHSGGENGAVTDTRGKHRNEDAQEAVLARTTLKFEEDWSAMDSLAETQAIDLKAIRAVLEAEVKDPD